MAPIDWEATDAACEHLDPQQDSLVRDIVSQVADKWTLWTMAVLAHADAPLRFSRIMEQVEGISQKSLTKTLRHLERDGLVTRVVFAEVPPRVEYQITNLGNELLEQVHPLWLWAVANVNAFSAAHARYDHLKPRVPAARSAANNGRIQSS